MRHVMRTMMREAPRDLKSAAVWAKMDVWRHWVRALHLNAGRRWLLDWGSCWPGKPSGGFLFVQAVFSGCRRGRADESRRLAGVTRSNITI